MSPTPAAEIVRPVELIERAQTSLAVLDPQALLTKAVELGQGVEVIERLLALTETVMKIQAKQAYDAAMAGFQKECPPIYKTAEGQVGTAKTQYAPLEEIMDKVRPVLGKHGLSCSWRSPRGDDGKPRTETGKIVRVCRVSHALGHYEESAEVVIPIGTAGAATPAQQVGIAIAYADRYSVKDILGLSPGAGEDKDGADPPGTNGGATHAPDAPGSRFAEGEVLISDKQQRMLWSVMRGHGWGQSEQELQTALYEILTGMGIEAQSAADIPAGRFDDILNKVKERKKA